MQENSKYRRLVSVSRILLAPMIMVMLFVGLYQKGFSSSNTVSWGADGAGLKFDGSAMAYTRRGFSIPAGGEGFAIDMMIEPDFQHHLSFQVILMLYGEDDGSQLLVGQWGRSLVVMNGSDYSNRAHTPKLYVPLGDRPGKKEVRITTGRDGTAVYIDRVQVRKSRPLILSVPPPPDCRLILGNSIFAKSGWHGALFALSFAAGGDGGDRFGYVFRQTAGESIAEQEQRGLEILLPSHLPVLKKKILTWPNFATVNPALFFLDFAVNILGFIPLGFILPVFLESVGLRRQRKSLLVSAVVVFGLSLTIEIAQIWIPSRHSSSLDLLLNSCGGLIGIFTLSNLKRRLGMV